MERSLQEAEKSSQLMVEYYRNLSTYNTITNAGQKIKTCDFVSRAAQITFISEVVSGIITASGN